MAKLDSAMPVLAPGTYRHNKSGRSYEVIGVAIHSESHAPMVVYRPLYEASFEYCVRPYESFIQHVEIAGKVVPRFEKVTDYSATNM